MPSSRKMLSFRLTGCPPGRLRETWRTHLCVPSRHSCRILCGPIAMRRSAQGHLGAWLGSQLLLPSYTEEGRRAAQNVESHCVIAFWNRRVAPPWLSVKLDEESNSTTMPACANWKALRWIRCAGPREHPAAGQEHESRTAAQAYKLVLTAPRQPSARAGREVESLIFQN
jgi:hypothetical protein